jgi:hypothetical protein
MESGCDGDIKPADCKSINMRAKMVDAASTLRNTCGVTPPSNQGLLNWVSPFAQFTVKALQRDNPGSPVWELPFVSVQLNPCPQL